MTTMATINQRGRKPAQLELVGGKSSRQRIWEVIRKSPTEFSLDSLLKPANVERETARTYLKCLKAGQFIEPFEGSDSSFRLVKNTGIEAPRLTLKGEPAQHGLASESMWRTLRMLGETDARSLVSHASASGVDISIRYAKAYITALKKAGYLRVIRHGSPNRLERIILKPAMNTGPRPPQVQKVKTVYDPNLNKVMYCEDPQEAL